MEILKLSNRRNYAEKISNLGERFRSNKLTGELASSTFDDFYELGNIIQENIDYFETCFEDPEKITNALKADKRVQFAIEKVFLRMLRTMWEYGQIAEKSYDMASKYWRIAGTAINALGRICKELGLEESFYKSMSTHGKGAETWWAFKEMLKEEYKNTRKVKNVWINHNGENIVKKAYSNQNLDRESLNSKLKEANDEITESNKPSSNKLIKNNIWQSDRPKCDTALRPDSKDNEVESDKSERDILSLILENIAQQSDKSKHDALHRNFNDNIPDSDRLKYDTLRPDSKNNGLRSDKLESRTLRSNLRNNVIESGKLKYDTLRPDKVLPPNSTLRPPGLGNVERVGEVMNKNDSDVKNAGKEIDNNSFKDEKDERSEIEKAETVMLEQKAAKEEVKDEKDERSEIEKAETVMLEQKAAKEEIKDEKDERFEIEKAETVVSEKTDSEVYVCSAKNFEKNHTFVNEKLKQPNVVRKSIRAKIFKWAMAITTATGFVGLMNSVPCSNGKKIVSGVDGAADAAAINPSSDASTNYQMASKDGGSDIIAGCNDVVNVNNNSAEEVLDMDNDTQKPVYRVNTSNEAFGNYLKYMKTATGIVSILKTAANTVNIELNGNETELQQRIKTAESLLKVAIQKSGNNPWVKKYFLDQLTAVRQYERDGKWNLMSKCVGAERFFEAIQVPVKLTPAGQDIIGYAPDVNPKSNPSILRIKTGAPTFYRILQEVGTNMQIEKDPRNLAKYDDFTEIKKITCQKVLEIGLENKDKDTKDGISYMHKRWCSENSMPQNLLDQALSSPGAPIKKESLDTSETKPENTNQPNKSKGTKKKSPSTQDATHTNLDTHTKRSPVQNINPTTDKVEEKGFFARVWSGIKSKLGFGKKDKVSTERIALSKTKAKQKNSKEEIPLLSWKDVIKQYF